MAGVTECGRLGGMKGLCLMRLGGRKEGGREGGREGRKEGRREGGRKVSLQRKRWGKEGKMGEKAKYFSLSQGLKTLHLPILLEDHDKIIRVCYMQFCTILYNNYL